MVNLIAKSCTIINLELCFWPASKHSSLFLIFSKLLWEISSCLAAKCPTLSKSYEQTILTEYFVTRETAAEGFYFSYFLAVFYGGIPSVALILQ